MPDRELTGHLGFRPPVFHSGFLGSCRILCVWLRAVAENTNREAEERT
jgi:hypothetical protein